MRGGQMTAQARDKQFRNAAIAVAVMLLSQLALVLGGLLSLHRVCKLRDVWEILLSGAVLGCALWLNWIFWQVHSPAGDRSLRDYWIYCAALAALSMLDDCGDSLWAIAALVSTPLGPWGIITSALPKIAKYPVVCGLSAIFSLAQALYYHSLLRCHQVGGKRT